jgi:branched-chain amino acid transport system permease protein
VTESLSLAVPAGEYAAGTELRTTPRRTPEELKGATYEFRRSPRVPINLIDVIIVTVSLVLMVGLQLLIFRTKMGAAMRALSHNIETASLMGINTNRVISFTFVLGSVLAASAAFLYPMKYPGLNQTAHGIWLLLGLKAFVAAVVGGIGNVRGAVLGGFLIAAIEFFGAYFYAPLRDVYVFALLILVLLYRPNGLLGKAGVEKV